MIVRGSFELMGLRADYFGDRGNIQEADMGRFNATKKESDRHRIKVPILRNIALTYPYLHDAATSDLKEVVQIMAEYQVGVTLSDSDTAAMVSFLESLTGEYKGALLQ